MQDYKNLCVPRRVSVRECKTTRTYVRTSSCFRKGMQDYENLCAYVIVFLSGNARLREPMCVPYRLSVRECKTTRTYVRTSSSFYEGMQDYENLCAYLIVFLSGNARLREPMCVPHRLSIRECKTTRTYVHTSSSFCQGMQDYGNLCAYLVVFP
jgi:hypothetical protein